MPRSRRLGNNGATCGSVGGVRLPELAVVRQQLRVVRQPRLGEQVGHGRALLVVAAAAPDRLVGAVQRLGVHVDLVLRLDHGVREGQRLRVEVDVVPPGQGPAPVEDHGVGLHGSDVSGGVSEPPRRLEHMDMTYRPLGRSGLMVSAVGIGCNAFGRRVDQSGVDRDPRHRPGGRGHSARHRGHLRRPPRWQRGDARPGAARPPRRVRGGHQVRHGHAGRQWRGPRRARVAALCTPRRRGEPAAAPDRPHRPLPAARPRPGDPDRGDARRTHRARARGQGPLHRLLELRRLAGRGRRVDLRDQGSRALRVCPEPLLAARPLRRGRAGPGVRAVRARRAPLLPAGVRPAHRQVPAAARQPPPAPAPTSTPAARAGWQRPTGTASRPWRRTPPSAASPSSTSPSPASPPSRPSPR